MDESVVKEIGNQLGLAVDSTAQFLTDVLPQYAAMKTSLALLWIVLCLVLLVSSVIAIWRGIKALKQSEGGDDVNELGILAILAGIIVAIFAIVPLLVNLNTFVTWQFPEAAFLQMVIDTLGSSS